MPKVIMEFDTVRESEEYNHARQGALYCFALNDTLEFIRKKIKYESDQYDESYLKALEDVRAFLVERTQDYGIM